eukprot:140907_1
MAMMAFFHGSFEILNKSKCFCNDTFYLLCYCDLSELAFEYSTYLICLYVHSGYSIFFYRQRVSLLFLLLISSLAASQSLELMHEPFLHEFDNQLFPFFLITFNWFLDGDVD